MRNGGRWWRMGWGLSACDDVGVAPHGDAVGRVEGAEVDAALRGEADDEAGSLPSGDVALEAAGDCGIVVSGPRELVIRAVGVVDDPVRTTWNGDPADPVSGA